MFARFKNAKSGDELNINTRNIESFTPNGEGSRITMLNGAQHEVVESNRSVRHAVKKAQATPEMAEA